ncbi:hypothetical protein BZA70DRAFT_266761 [Myxozyma melibiosi]|uniref:Secreted protein n=1 Tax=Myxozyma melibiosi TaxID=54550 RepID=A0ABR1F9C6_9ASCO
MTPDHRSISASLPLLLLPLLCFPAYNSYNFSTLLPGRELTTAHLPLAACAPRARAPLRTPQCPGPAPHENPDRETPTLHLILLGSRSRWSPEPASVLVLVRERRLRPSDPGHLLTFFAATSAYSC